MKSNCHERVSHPYDLGDDEINKIKAVFPENIAGRRIIKRCESVKGVRIEVSHVLDPFAFRS